MSPWRAFAEWFGYALGALLHTAWLWFAALNKSEWLQLGVAVGTAGLAWATFVMAKATRGHLDFLKSRDAEEREPRVFVKDVWIPSVAGQPPLSSPGSTTLDLSLRTKGVANLGVYALAIHRAEVLAEGDVVIGRAHPMALIPAQDLIGGESEYLFLDPIRPGRGVTLGRLLAESKVLRLFFRSGGDVGGTWCIDLPRDSNPPRSRWLNFKGGKSRCYLCSPTEKRAS